MHETILITGANRGIGLEFVKQYLAQGNKEIIACCREPNKADALKSLMANNPGKVLPLDVSNPQSIQALVKQLDNQAIDILINNAGVYGDKEEKFGTISPDNMRQVFLTNVIGVVNLTQRLLPNIETSQAKKVVVITSQMGSIADNQSGGSYTYRSSKAAINAILRSLAIDLTQQEISIIGLHPGWVKTDMGGSKAPVSPEDSVAGMINVIADNQVVSEKGFVDFQGKTLPW